MMLNENMQPIKKKYQETFSISHNDFACLSCFQHSYLFHVVITNDKRLHPVMLQLVFPLYLCAITFRKKVTMHILLLNFSVSCYKKVPQPVIGNSMFYSINNKTCLGEKRSTKISNLT